MATGISTRSGPLASEQLADFERDGFLLLPGFYDLPRQIEPIQRAAYDIIGLVIEKNGLGIERPPYRPESFDAGYAEVIRRDRTLGGVIYDAVKQIPAFVRLSACAQHDRLMAQIRGTDAPAIAAGGSGIRIDNPSEERFRADWHQDYPSQLRSLDGLVFWSPLVPIEPDMGPVHVAVGSHKDGLAPIRTTDPDHPEKAGAYAVVLDRKEERIGRYPHVAPLTAPGDLLIMDYLVLHASGHNRGTRSRWSMQMRYFNFREPTGVRIDWRGSFAAGVDIKEIHPELVVD